MKFIRHFENPVNNNIGRQEPIKLNQEVFGINLISIRFYIKMGKKTSGMNPRVRTAAPHQTDSLTHLQTETFFELRLHRVCIFLSLPTVIGQAVVRQMYEISHKIFEANVGIFCNNAA